ncbi:acyl-CoA dehydrogenase family protein [Comamonas koreensis]|uniref:acyl-CoA dehydrogenase family protein n=1 Tax=Comamonas koreensis TaxID=160825 RepID=UPI001E349F3E|nr:acyl-CoA dehydrogenase family protein [Comamonas koreensis]
MSAVLQVLQPPREAASPGPALDEAALLARAQALIGKLAALAEAHDASGAAPASQFALLHQADLLRLTIAREAGGHGAGLASARAVMGAIAQGDPAVALILAMHYSNHAAIARSQRAGQGEWPPALADELIAASLQGPALLNAAQVEPELGSPSHGGLPAARARRVAGGWQLSGHKVYVTGGPLLAWISVLALTDEPEPRLGSFVLPRGTAGARLVDTWNPLGMRATASQDLVLDGAWVPDHHAVGLRPASLGL